VRRGNALVTAVNIAHRSSKGFRPNGSHDPANRIFIQQRISTNGHFYLDSFDEIRVKRLNFFKSDRRRRLQQTKSETLAAHGKDKQIQYCNLLFKIHPLHARLQGFHNTVHILLNRQVTSHHDANRLWIGRIQQGVLDSFGSRVLYGTHGKRIKVCTNRVYLDKTPLDANTTTCKIVACRCKEKETSNVKVSVLTKATLRHYNCVDTKHSTSPTIAELRERDSSCPFLDRSSRLDVWMISPPTGTLDSKYVVGVTAVIVSATPPAAAKAQADEAVLGTWREAEAKVRRIRVARLTAATLREAIRVEESILIH
jgi:hypothetical protein